MESHNFKCEKCEKEFSSKEALEMHMNAKHYEAPKGMKKLDNISKKKVRNWIIIIVILAVIIGVAYVLAFNSDNKNDFCFRFHNNGSWPNLL